jgi:hypothetical protein
LSSSPMGIFKNFVYKHLFFYGATVAMLHSTFFLWSSLFIFY